MPGLSRLKLSEMAGVGKFFGNILRLLSYSRIWSLNLNLSDIALYRSSSCRFPLN